MGNQKFLGQATWSVVQNMNYGCDWDALVKALHRTVVKALLGRGVAFEEATADTATFAVCVMTCKAVTWVNGGDIYNYAPSYACVYLKNEKGMFFHLDPLAQKSYMLGDEENGIPKRSIFLGPKRTEFSLEVVCTHVKYYRVPSAPSV